MSAETSLPSLDFLAAKYSQKISSEFALIAETEQDKNYRILENLSTKALGVLQEQGVYALFLFLLARKGDGKTKEEKTAWILVRELLSILAEPPLKALNLQYPQQLGDAVVTENHGDILDHIVEHILPDQDTLFLVRDLVEQTLIYVRYAAKARKSKE